MVSLAFGKEVSSTELSPWRFCSKRLDSETDLLYFGRRYYSSELGRWITPDPIGFDGGPNLYAYALNNPFAFIDPYGLDPHSLGGRAMDRTARDVSDVKRDRRKDAFTIKLQLLDMLQ